jgi:hypothetical protein
MVQTLPLTLPLFAALLAITTGVPALGAEADRSALLAPLIPSAPGKKACFRGTFKSVPIETERYGTGKPNEPVPYIYTTHRIDELTLQVEFERTPARPTTKEDPGYDRRYLFVLSARFAGRRRPQFAAGDCPWHDRNVDFETQRGTVNLRNTSALHCGIECDGGGMSIVRAKEAKAVTFTVDPRRHLRLTAPCGGGEKSLTLSGRDNGIALELVPTEAVACRPLERWRKRQ